MAIDRPETNDGAPPLGAGQHRRNFLVPRGMAALPSGEESCDDAVALKRSKRLALFFGQIRPLKRPFGAVETRGLNGDVAILKPIMMTRRVTPALPVALRLRPCASLFPDCSTGIAPNRVLVRPQTLLRTVLRSYVPRLRLKLIRCLAAVYHRHAPDDEDGSYPRLVSIGGSLWFMCVKGIRQQDRLPPSPIGMGKQL